MRLAVAYSVAQLRVAWKTGERQMASQKAKLTKRVVDAAQPNEQRYAIHDTELAGFRLYVQPSGKKTFNYRYRVGGGRDGTIREPKIGDHGTLTVDQARGIARDWAAVVRHGGDPAASRKAERAAPKMAELFQRYLSEHARPHKKPASIRQDERMIEKRLAPALGKQKVADVTRDDVASLHQGLSDTPYEANRVLALLSKAFNLAEIWGWRMDGTNPCRHVRKYKEKKRKRFLSPAEIGRLGEVLRTVERDCALELPTAQGENAQTVAIRPEVAAAVRLIILTGGRKSSEILSLRWNWIDFDAGRINLPDSKTGEKTLPLSGAARAVLEGITRVEGNPHVFVGRKTGEHLVNIDKAWRAIRRAAGLDEVRIHDLRHTFGAFGAGSGHSLPMIGALLGHTQPATTQRYAHLADDPLRDASEKISGELARHLGG